MKLHRQIGVGGAHIGMFRRSLMLCEPEKDKKGGGGGGGDGGGGDDDLEAKIEGVVKKVLGGVNIQSAVADHVKRALKGKDFTDALGGVITSVMEKAGFKPKPEGDPPDEDADKTRDDKGKFKGKLDPEVQAKIANAEKLAADAKKTADAERDLRLKAERRADEDEERQVLTKHLTGHVRPEQLDDVVEILHKRVVRDPEDKKRILWKGDKWKDGEDADNSGNYEEFEFGVTKWRESPKGKSYRPPRDISGGNTGNPGAGARRGTTASDQPASDAEVGAHIFRVGRQV